MLVSSKITTTSKSPAINNIRISLPHRSWIASASGYGTPGKGIKVSFNILYDKDVTKMEERHFLMVPHFADHDVDVNIDFDDLLLISSFDVEDDSFSIYEVEHDD